MITIATALTYSEAEAVRLHAEAAHCTVAAVVRDALRRAGFVIRPRDGDLPFQQRFPQPPGARNPSMRFPAMSADAGSVVGGTSSGRGDP